MNEALPSRPFIAKNSSLPRAVWAVIAAFFLISTMVQQIVLLDFGPDEPWHLDYAYTLATQHRLPVPPVDAVNTQLHENHLVQHPPLYYLAMAGVWKISGATQPPRSLAPGVVSFDKFENNAIFARRLMRLISTLLICVALIFIARTLALLEVPVKWQVFLVALAAASPMLQYVSSVINNENLAIAYSSLLCLVLVSRLKTGTCTPRQALFLGLLCGAGMLIKQTTMFAVPLALWTLWITGGNARARLITPFLGGALATGIWWPLHNLLKAGDPFPTFTPHPNQPTMQILLRDWNVILGEWLRVLLETVFLPDWSLMFVPRIFETVVVLGCVAAIVLLFLLGLRRQDDLLLARLRAMSFAAMGLLLLGVLQYCMFKDQRAQLGGRYLLNSLPWCIVFLAACLPQKRGSAQENEAPGAANVPETASVAIKEATPGPIPVILLGFLLVVDAAWWFIVWTHYQTQIATELQRRVAGG